MSDALETTPGRDLDALAFELRREVEGADRAWQDAVAHAVRAGELLIEAKAAIKHGGWLAWLEANFAASERTANGYMRLARNPQRVADSDTVRSALAVLAAPRASPKPAPPDLLAAGRDVAARRGGDVVWRRPPPDPELEAALADAETEVREATLDADQAKRRLITAYERRRELQRREGGRLDFGLLLSQPGSRLVKADGGAYISPDGQSVVNVTAEIRQAQNRARAAERNDQ